MPTDLTDQTAERASPPPAGPIHAAPQRQPAAGAEPGPLDADAAEPVPHEHLPSRSDDN
jgi:hypothetical protein